MAAQRCTVAWLAPACACATYPVALASDIVLAFCEPTPDQAIPPSVRGTSLGSDNQIGLGMFIQPPRVERALLPLPPSF